MTIGEVKAEIEQTHRLKPKAANLKLFFAGKLLSNEQVLQDLLSNVIIYYEADYI